ncbi:MAG: hypothetical protein WCT45_03680 [Candidatus Paceibacterota bacterium]
MNKQVYAVGTFALALALSGLPAAALAESGDGDSAQTQAVQESVREGQKQDAEVSREQQKQQLEGSSTQGRPSIKGGDRDEDMDLTENEDEDQASSLEDLKQKIEVRKHELEQEVASSTPNRRDIVENANPVRLAVHTLLASRDLLDTKGGIGQQVSEIAKQVNDSVATTTSAETKIQARGFLTRLLFGGDRTSAEVIAQEAAQNQERIDSLTALLAQAGVTADMQATLDAQIAALKEAQVRLKALADREQSAWGLFSWRF